MHIRTAVKRPFLAIIGAVILLQTVFWPKAAFAVDGAAGGAMVVGSDGAQVAVDAGKEAGKLTLAGAVFTGLINLTSFMIDRAAYDLAVMLATGAAGEDPLVEYRNVWDYVGDYGAAVAGEAVGLISEEIRATGGVLSNFNLCAPSNPDILVSFRLGIRSAFVRPEPRCEWNDIHTNWTGYLAQIERDFEGGEGILKNEMVLTQLASAFDPTTNEFAVGVQLYSDILGKARKDADIAQQKLLFQGTTKDVVDVVTGNVQTPSKYINYVEENVWDASLSKNYTLGELFANNENAFVALGMNGLSMFTNTFLTTFTNKMYNGLFDFDAVTGNPFDEGMLATSSREDAQERFRSLLTATPLEITNYNMLSEFSSCPSSSRGLYNCVLDSSFASAIARADADSPLTIEEAIEEGLIDGNWALIPSWDKARNQDPYCYTYGFCHSNLVKLRKARIIPVGWELAADSQWNSENDPVTLQEAIDGFDDCSADGEPNGSNPWCKLIDPNWVLKYPETQCKNLAYGQLLETPASDSRQQECVDMPSCIDENDDGTCSGGYGYCVREANVWRFRGESCPEYASSCLAFTDSQGDDANLLLNTVDYAGCDEGNAGCMWYATEKMEGADGTFDWPTVADVAAEEASGDAYQSRMYFNAEVEECDDEAGGCAELVNRDDDLRLNVIPNSSFENDADTNNQPDVWQFTSGAVDYDTESGYARTGDAAVNPGASSIAYQAGIVLEQGAFYTLSYYARQVESFTSTETASVIVAMSGDQGSTVDLSGTSYTSGCTIFSGDDSIMEVRGTPDDETYTRYTCTFTVPSLTDASENVVAFVDLLSANVWIDDMQLEQGEDASDYHDGYSETDLSYTYAKIPPAYLGCTGDDSDPEECANYAQVCAETDVGCLEYIPTNGDPSVYGVTSSLDECPSSCVGYDTFKQEETLYEPEGDFPVYFIPSTAEECEAEEVGCDEFTNLNDESLNYFTYLRACVTPEQASANIDDQGETFYTWEGSDLEGYQLVTWTLLESDMDTSATSTYIADGTVTSPNGDTETSPGEAPCTTWTTTESGITCDDDAYADGHFDTDSEYCDEHDDILSNPNCREFYDADGDIHYRDWSLTVTVNEACVSYRKTDLVGLNEDIDGDSIDDGEVNCEASGGYFNAESSACIYYGYAEESSSCSERSNGCREYTGGRSGNSRVALEETFESGDLTDWDAASASTVDYSNESVATDGHSLSSAGTTVWTFMGGDSAPCEETSSGVGCDETDSTFGGECTTADGDTYCGTLDNELYAGKTYTVSFWAKGDGAIAVGFDINADTSGASTIALDASEDAIFTESTDGSSIYMDLSTSSWQEYRLGPLNMTQQEYEDFGEGTVLAFIPQSNTVGFYIDNIVLREGEDSITVIKDSWVTPAECDESPDGVASPQYYLGCQEYSTQDGDTANLKSFSSLCSEEALGCEAYFTTEQSESPYAEVYGATCSRLDTDTSSAVDCYYGATSGAFDTTTTFLCTIGVSETSCTFDMEWYVPVDSLPSHISYGPATHIVAADTSKYFIVGPEDECTSSEAGCMEVGLPTFSQDRTAVTGGESMFLMNVPDEYADILCAHAELFCEAWDTDEDGTYYFKNPGEQTCEYRTDVTINNVTYDGWFRTDSDEFCYGTGSCSVSGVSCTADADCGATGGECVIDDGSYVIGGEASGIWRNGDAGYDGWVGTCEAKYSTCAEFQDLMQTDEGDIYGESDGESYFYLDNAALEETSLVSSQKCNGKVSQEEGCVLFNDATETSQDYNASASYVASAHADDLFGDDEFALVNPISCDGDSTIVSPAGETVDLCASRCVYPAEHEDQAGEMLFANVIEYSFTGEYTYGRDDIYQFGQSCYVDSDCPGLTDIYGEEMEGRCAAEVPVVADSEDIIVSEDVPRLDDDSNRVLKVNRDRECSEWLTCAEAQEVWDERTGTYRTICEDIDLCTTYAGDGDSSFCSEWDQDDVATVLDLERYTNRDVSWYGHEYSGMAIPDLLPIQMLDQKNVAPPVGYCDLSDDYQEGDALFDANQGAECEVDADCDGGAASGWCVGIGEREVEVDYRLVYSAGSCSTPYNTSCTVGYCEDTGAACSADSQCGSASCIVGTCYEVSTTSCQDDSGCSGDDVCLSGVCADVGATIGIGETCASGETLYEDAVVKNGTCIRNECLVTPDGLPIDLADTEAKDCRAYPEVGSPFPNEVVEEWKNPDPNEAERQTGGQPFEGVEMYLGFDDGAPDMVPYSFKNNFENVNWCNGGEDCTCSYKKVVYGENEQEFRYYSSDSGYPDQSVGVCVGGGFDGAYCSKSSNGVDGIGDWAIWEGTCERGWDGDTDKVPNEAGDVDVDGDGVIEESEMTDANLLDDDVDDVKGGGTCVYPVQEDLILGLDGYCLERDTGININGLQDEAHGACLSWLPVDQLAGSTDLYAKHKGAGYFDDAFYCTDTRLYVDLSVSDFGTGKGDTACAEQNTAWGCDTGNEDQWQAQLEECAEHVACPDGYYAIMGQCSWNDAKSTGTLANSCTDAGYNDCPYICVPDDSYNETTGGSCEPGSGSFMGDSPYRSEHGTDVYVYVDDLGIKEPKQENYAAFDALVAEYADCRVRGVQVDEDIADDLDFLPCSNASWPEGCIHGSDDSGSNGGYRSLYFSNGINNYESYYPACREFIQVADGEQSFAWTDKILNTATDGKIVDATYPDVAYWDITAQAPFGSSDRDPSTVVEPSGPLRVASCSNNFVQPTDDDGDGYFDDCSSGTLFEGTGSDPDSPESRSFIEFSFPHGGYNLRDRNEQHADELGSGSSTIFLGFDVNFWVVTPSGSGATPSIFSRLVQIFAKPYIGYASAEWDGAQSESDSNNYATTSGTAYTDYDVRATEGTPPDVWALDHANCDGTECEEDQNHHLTLNDTNEGDIQSDGGYLRGYLKFYAAADKNQLPIRRVIVDWGDGEQTGSETPDNYFKNHRGFQEGTTVSICDTEVTSGDYEWGKNSQSCDPNYFSYNHVYNCTEGLIEQYEDENGTCSDGDGDGIFDNSPCVVNNSEGDFCVYVPKVHVRDNWGWCTGTCDSTDSTVNTDGGEGCFDGVGGLTSPDERSECNFNAPYDSSTDPWVYYEGAVYVSP